MNLKHKIPLYLSSLTLAVTLTACNDLDGSTDIKEVPLTPEIEIPAGSTDRAASVWLKFNDNKVGDTIIQDVYVPTKGLTPYTYYSVLNWNAGMEGGGYAGIQDHPDGRNFIFSIWDPSNGETITAPFTGEGTEIENFGGEGTGLKSWNFSLGWQPDSWYTLVAKIWDKNGHTMFGYWSHDKTNDIWSHLVTMDYPVANVRFFSNTSAFVEDWGGTGNKTRTALFSNGHKRLLDGSWLGFSQADFHVVQEEATEIYNDNFNAVATENYYRITTGGAAEPNIEVIDTLARPYAQITPVNPMTEYSLDRVTNSSISWFLPASSTPQLRYTIKINGDTVASNIAPEVREVTFNTIKNDDLIEIEIENILGKTSLLKATVTDGQIEINDDLIINDTILELVSGESITIDSLQKGETLQVSVAALGSSSRVSFQLEGLNGDADLFVKKSEKAYPDDYDCISAGGGSREYCVLPVSKESTYYALIKATSDITNLKVTADQDGSADGMLNSVYFIVSSPSPAQSGNELKFAFDGNPDTMWHTSWGDDLTSYPHEVYIDLGQAVDVNRFEYSPRTAGLNGTIVRYEIYITDSTADYGEVVHSGTWAANNKLKLEVFTPKNGRFIKFVALEEAGGGDWASASEFRVGFDNGEIYDPIYGEESEKPEEPTDNGNIEVNSTLLDNTTFIVTSNSPAQPGNELALAFDSNESTIWHTNWDDSTVGYPHEVIIDLGETYDVNRFDYAPRNGGGNGTVVAYEVYVSNSNTTFSTVASSGTWDDNAETKTATFNAVSGRFVKFVAVAERGGNAWAAAREINVGVMPYD